MKLDRVEEIKQLASEGNAGISELIELVADGLTAQSKRMKKLRDLTTAHLSIIEAQLKEQNAFLLQLTSPFFQLIEEDKDTEEE